MKIEHALKRGVKKHLNRLPKRESPCVINRLHNENDSIMMAVNKKNIPVWNLLETALLSIVAKQCCRQTRQVSPPTEERKLIVDSFCTLHVLCYQYYFDIMCYLEICYYHKRLFINLYSWLSAHLFHSTMLTKEGLSTQEHLTKFVFF